MWWWVSNWYSGWGSKFTIIVFPCYIRLIWIIQVGSGQNFTTCKEAVPAVNVKFIIWRTIYWYFVCRVNIRDWDIRDWRQGSCSLFEIRDVRVTTTCQSQPDQNSWNGNRKKSNVHLENGVKSDEMIYCFVSTELPSRTASCKRWLLVLWWAKSTNAPHANLLHLN